MSRRMWDSGEYDNRTRAERMEEPHWQRGNRFRRYATTAGLGLAFIFGVLTSPLTTRWYPLDPLLSDANGDGKPDKILRERKYVLGVPAWVREKEVLYGTGIEINGKQLFLPAYLWKEYQKKP